MKRLFALIAVLGFHAVALAAPEDELLEPDKAFALSTQVLDASTIEATWKIAPGYYLYRDKFKFESLDAAVTLKSPLLPAGKRKKDPLFGEVETYVKSVTARVPVDRRGSDARTARVKITAQGCNEPVGVCYPPIVKEIDFQLPALVATAAGAPKSTSDLSSLKDLARSVAPSLAGPEPVDPEKAFVIQIAPTGGDAVKVRFEIDECCYLYRGKTTFKLAGTSSGMRLGKIELPAGKVKVDEFVGKTEIYEKPFEVLVPIDGLAQAGADATLAVGYQGCSEKGVAICYPPAIKTFNLQGMSTVASAPVKTKGPDKRFIAYMLGAFGIGLLLTFTPCVLPMIPILSSVLVGSTANRRITKLEGGMMSSAYVLGTAATYTIAGVVAGATGEQLQAYFQSPWALATFATLFVVLSLSMFGMYELQMPSFLQSHLHAQSQHVHGRFKHIKGGALAGLFGMGMLSALVIGACVSPLVISALGVAIANRDPVLGGAIMFSMALGMGVILIAIGVGAGFLLPKAGPWMDRVKHVFGVMLIGVAIYLLGLIPEVPVLLLWAALLIVVGVYLGATQSLPHGATGWQYLWKGVGTVSLIWGIAAMLGGFAGNRDILSPLPLGTLTGALTSGDKTVAAAEAHRFQRVASMEELDRQFAAAKRAGKPVLLDYYASWCTDCIRLEKATFSQARVQEEMKRFVLVQADVTDPNDPQTKAIKSRFGVFGPPAILFFDKEGNERRELRTYGFRGPDDFIALLRKI